MKNCWWKYGNNLEINLEIKTSMLAGNVEKLLWKMEDHSWGTVNGDKCFRLSKAISRHCALRDHIYTHMFCMECVILKILKCPRISFCKAKQMPQTRVTYKQQIWPKSQHHSSD